MLFTLFLVDPVETWHQHPSWQIWSQVVGSKFRSETHPNVPSMCPEIWSLTPQGGGLGRMWPHLFRCVTANASWATFDWRAYSADIPIQPTTVSQWMIWSVFTLLSVHTFEFVCGHKHDINTDHHITTDTLLKCVKSKQIAELHWVIHSGHLWSLRTDVNTMSKQGLTEKFESVLSSIKAVIR